VIAMPGIADRIRLELLVQRLDYHLSDLPGARRRQIRREIRANTRAAAADVGARQALANLGHPRVLAAGYLAAEGRPLPQFRKGAWWAAAALALYIFAAMIFATGFVDGADAASDLDRRLTTSFLGASVEATPGEPSFAVTFNPTALIVPAVVFLLASRAWRALPPVRRRLAARPGGAQ
jgi:hypothetical protein